MKPLKQKKSITLDPDYAADIQLLADYDDRSLSSYIICCCENMRSQKKTC